MNVAAAGCASTTGFSSGSHGSPPPLKSSASASGSSGSDGVVALVSLIVGSQDQRAVPATARTIDVGNCAVKTPDPISENRKPLGRGGLSFVDVGCFEALPTERARQINTGSIRLSWRRSTASLQPAFRRLARPLYLRERPETPSPGPE